MTPHLNVGTVGEKRTTSGNLTLRVACTNGVVKNRGGETAAIESSPEAHAAISMNTARNAVAATTIEETTQTDGTTMTVHSHTITEEGAVIVVIGRVAITATVAMGEGSPGDEITVGVMSRVPGEIAISPASARAMVNSLAAGSVGRAEIRLAGSDMAGVIIAADISAASRECDEREASIGVLAADHRWVSHAEGGLRSVRSILPMRTTTTK